MEWMELPLPAEDYNVYKGFIHKVTYTHQTSTVLYPFQAPRSQIVTLWSVQGHTGLTHSFDFLTFGHSGAQD